MSRKAVTVIALGALLTFLGVVAFHKSANYLLGYSLRALFESETGCDVTLRHPRITFFPLRGEVSDVSIRHRTEKPGQGFFAERVTVRPDISGIFSKIVLLRDLRVEGAHAFATQKESGFYNTIDFVASDSPPNPNRPWHAFVSRGWSIRVYEISVTPRAQEDHTLVLRTGKARVAFDQLNLSFVRQSHNSPPLFDTRGEAKLFSVLGRELQRKIGAVSATGVIGQGKFRLANGTIRPEGFEGETRVTGELDLPGEGEHHLNATGELSPEYIASLVPEIRELTLARGMRGTFSAAISGPLEEPVFTGTTLATFTSVAESADGTLCDVRTLGVHNVVST
ncbi:MAG: hypothetical protein IT290_07835, partial [Deltaproteobacteria bacterium]|nr:hypothetical protein [Deltaproteobacteria bacterium]